MAQTVEEAQAALDAAQQAFDDAKAKGTVSQVAAASKALSAARRALSQAQAGGLTASQQRTQAYTTAKQQAQEEAKKDLPPLPEPDVNVYNYVWRQDVGGTGGRYDLVKTPNPLYDPSTNTVVDPATGQRKTVVMSTYSGKPNPLSDAATGTPGPSGTPGPTTTTLPYTGGATTTTLPYIGGATQQNLTYTASDGKTFADASSYATYQANLDAQKQQRQSAYDLLYSEFAQYGLGSLVEPLKNLIQQGVSPSEFTLRLRETEPYKKRFAANAQRVAKGLRALSESEYINLENAYQD